MRLPLDPNQSSKEPLITVLMTVYNGMPYVQTAVESILDQTEQNFDFVIVDDGSDEEARSYLESLDDHRIVLIQQTNQGTAAAANRGLRECKTKYIARMDADDFAVHNRLQRQLEFLEANPNVGIVGSQVAPLGTKSVGGSLDLPTSHEKIFSEMMMGRHGLAHSSIMIRRSVLESAGGYWSLPLIDDWDMMLRVGEISQLANMDEVLLHYRVHSGSINGTNMQRIQTHIAYAVDRAKRRQSEQPEIDFETFLQLRALRPAWVKAKERADIYALVTYRQAMSEIQGGRPLLGRARLAWASLFSPGRTCRRITRSLRAKISKKDVNASAKPTHVAETYS